MTAALSDSELSAKEYLDLLKKEIDQLGKADYVDALRNALNLERRPGNIEHRRSDFALKVNRNSDTIEKWENRGFEELARSFECRIQAAEFDQPIESPSATEENHQYVFEMLERTARYRGTSLIEVMTTRIVRCESGKLDYITSRFRHSTAPTAVTMHAYAGCSIEDSTLNPAGTLVSRIKLSQTIGPGERHRLTTRITIDADSPSNSWLNFGAGTERLHEQAVLRFQFDPEALPVAAWCLENVTYMSTPGVPTPHNRLEIDPSGYMEKEFNDLKPGLVQVIAWEWPGK